MVVGAVPAGRLTDPHRPRRLEGVLPPVRLLLPALLLALVWPAAPARADDPLPPATPTLLSAPTVVGEPAFREVLTADPGTWAPAPEVVVVEWLRNGAVIDTGEAHRATRADIGADLVVRVIASNAVGSTVAESQAVRIRKARLTGTGAEVEGTARFGRILRAVAPRWSRKPDRVRVTWLRDGTPVKGATGRRYATSHRDVGHEVSVRFVATRAHHRRAVVESRAVAVRHRVGVRRTVTYDVQTRGAVTAPVKRFRRLAQQTYDDPRGWRGSGIRFRRVARGGDFTLVLATPDQLPRFSSGCSAEWSCRVGRFVVINQVRWQQASPAWNRHGGSLRGYRHMVVNHETGHWLGHAHRGCPRAGAPAPVMQQQSKDLQGCRFNPWPTAAERRTPRLG